MKIIITALITSAKQISVPLSRSTLFDFTASTTCFVHVGPFRQKSDLCRFLEQEFCLEMDRSL